MSFKFSKGYAKKWLLLSCLFTGLTFSVAAEITQKKQVQPVKKSSENHVSFSAQPANCIALRYGRTCYANVKINWSSDIKQDYCLLIKQEKTARTVQQNIKCWKSSNGNEIIFNFESNKKIEFQLISSKDKQVIAETAVEVSWVHEATPRKRRWRIF
ncbi:MAG: hypothetical protein ACJA0T_001978 [Colwellia sp.]|jgi:hypothetical protein